MYWFLNMAGSAVGKTGPKNLSGVGKGGCLYSSFSHFSSERILKYNARICFSKLVEACS